MSATSATTHGFNLRGMDHFTVLTSDCDKTQAFYELIGLRVGPRPPDLGGTGLWLYSGDKPILHVIKKSEMPEDTAGMLDHMAFRATGMDRAIAMLKEHDIPWRMRRLNDPFGVWQMFFKDPFGANVELDFDGTEPGPAGWSHGNQWGEG
jgi:catechol 2,3-dioxygenase-like lactoylglutathione lyase family enzyme